MEDRGNFHGYCPVSGQTGVRRPGWYQARPEGIGSCGGRSHGQRRSLQSQIMFTQLKEDPLTRELLLDYFSSLYQSIPYRDSRTIGVRIVSEVGIEVLLALATAGAGNVARRAAQVGAQGAHALKATRIGPFTAKAIDLMADLTKALRQASSKTPDAPGTKWVNGNRGWESVPAEPRRVENSSPKKTKPERTMRQRRGVPPASLEDGANRLRSMRDEIKVHGHQNKYSDSELTALGQSGSVAAERFQVRFMEKSYLADHKTPDDPLSGKMGGPFKGESGTGVKYWSTSFDQLEDADTDPKLISEKVGIKYDPNKEYALVIVDNEKAAGISGTKSITPTFKDLGDFAKEELPDQFSPKTIDQIYTPEYQEKYNQLYKEAEGSGINIWDKNGLKDYKAMLKSQGEDPAMFEKRLNIHGKLGSNEDFLGNGLTKNLIENSNNEYGVVETFTFERTPQNLAALKENGAITIIENLKPIGH